MIETRLGDFEETILLLVGILGDNAYAFNIAREFKSQTGRTVSIGAVHSTLNRLEKKDFLNSKFGKPTSERGGRRKRIYTITAPGQIVLTDSRNLKLSLWSQFPNFATDKLVYGI